MQTSLCVEEDGYLIIAFWKRPHVWSYTLRVMRLRGNEFWLNRGRFHNFALRSQRHRIVLDQRGIVTHMSEEIVDWIAENNDAPWSMKGIARPSGVDLEFSFEDSVAAAYFALRWR